MSESSIQLEIQLLLPEVEDERDQCVERLQDLVKEHKGIQKAHITQEDGRARLCVHYDADVVSLSQVQRWAEQAGAELTQRFRHDTFRITDMNCADCATSIEHILAREEGVLDVTVNYAAEKMWAEYDARALDRAAIERRIRAIGYSVQKEEAPKGWLRQNWQLVLSVASGVFLVVGFFGETFIGLAPMAALGFYVLAYLTGGYDATWRGFHAARNLRFDIDFLMVVAAIGAALLGEWAEGALLLFLFSLGHTLEHYAMDRARHAIQALGEMTPRTARVQREDRETELPVEELLRGDRVIVRPGERVPIDGEIVEGGSTVDQSPITGESVPVEKGSGDKLYAGTVNGEGALEIEVTRLAQDTTLARVIQMVEEAQAQKSPTQQFSDHFSRIFVPAVLAGTLIVILVPPLIGWLPLQESFLRGMTILVAASPCALAIATPSAVLSGIAQAARNGVLIKGGMHLENLGRLEAVAFDKTGTLTYGELEVTALHPLNGGEERELLRIAAAVESRSGHPLAQAIVRKAQSEGLEDLPKAGEFESITGRGVRAVLADRVVRIGSLHLFEAPDNPSVPQDMEEEVERLEADGTTTVLIHDGSRFRGIIGLADQPREEAHSTLERLQRLGIRALIMLTGDNDRVADAIAGMVGLTDYRANLLPEEKVTAIQELLDEYGQVAMVGDGVNDAPALATSTVGIAMGGAGTDVALETADVALMSDDLSRLSFAVGLSRQSRRVIRQNVYVALGVIALLIPTALFGVTGIGLAIVFHESSTLLVVANALRLLGYRDTGIS